MLERIKDILWAFIAEPILNILKYVAVIMSVPVGFVILMIVMSNEFYAFQNNNFAQFIIFIQMLAIYTTIPSIFKFIVIAVLNKLNKKHYLEIDSGNIKYVFIGAIIFGVAQMILSVSGPGIEYFLSSFFRDSLYPLFYG